MKSLWWSPIQYNLFPYKKKKFRHKHKRISCEHENGHQEFKETSHKIKQPCQYLDNRLVASRTVRK